MVEQHYISWFACDIRAAVLVYNNNRVVNTLFCCVHRHGRHTLCHFSPWRLNANQEYFRFAGEAGYLNK